MSVCPICGSTPDFGAESCGYHTMTTSEKDWAIGNKVMCDWIHRGIELKRLSKPDRDEISDQISPPDAGTTEAPSGDVG